MKREWPSLLLYAASFVGITITAVGGQQAQPVATGVLHGGPGAGRTGGVRAAMCRMPSRPTFRGSGDAPAVAGPDFTAKWGPRAVNELFTYLVQTMPPTSPGALGEAGHVGGDGVPAADQRGTRGPAAVDAHSFDADERAARRTTSSTGARTGDRRARRGAAGAGRRHRRRPGSRWDISRSRRDRSRRGEELRACHLRTCSRARRPATG